MKIFFCETQVSNSVGRSRTHSSYSYDPVAGGQADGGRKIELENLKNVSQFLPSIAARIGPNWDLDNKLEFCLGNFSEKLVPDFFTSVSS